MKDPNDRYVCQKGKCTNPSDIIYLGTPLCDKHWLEHCNKEEIKNDK